MFCVLCAHFTGQKTDDRWLFHSMLVPVCRDCVERVPESEINNRLYKMEGALVNGSLETINSHGPLLSFEPFGRIL